MLAASLERAVRPMVLGTERYSKASSSWRCIVKGLTILCVVLVALSAVSSAPSAQTERPKWELGGGLRLNYMSLNGGFTAHRNADGFETDIQYDEIGMNTYSPSFALFLAGRYKKWNLEFGGSRGSYEGGFVAKTDIVRDDWQIDAGSKVDGTVDLQMYLLSTAFGLIQKKHDLGVGIGLMALYMGANYTTTDTEGNAVKLGDDYWFPMPFLAVSGRLNFDRLRIIGTAGGAIFKGNMEGDEFDVGYYIIDVSVAYEFLRTKRWTYIADVGYRNMYLNLDIENEKGWYSEKDIYRGPYATIRVNFASEEIWKFGRK